MNTIINMPPDVASIIDTLETNGHEAYAVGGCVRDAIMGRTPHDWDITTSAKPEEVKSLFPRTIDTGILHGTVTVMKGKTGYEVTTYRIDGEYSDGRHPDQVTFTGNLIEDLKRRDFTINAMAYNNRAGIVDAFEGQYDLDNKIIRCVREPVCRFTEDALRMLRALRFSAQLDFSIDESTVNGIKALAATLTKISRERIQTELDKLITSDNPDRILFIRSLDIAPHIFEKSACLSDCNLEIYEKICLGMKCVSPDHYLRWAMFMFFEKNPRGVLKNLKFDNKTIDICQRLIDAARHPLPTDMYETRKLIVRFGRELFDSYLFDFLNGLCDAGLYEYSSSRIDEVKTLYSEICANGDCVSIKDMAINGTDLINNGFQAGRELGSVINALFEDVLREPSLNNYDTLLKKALSMKQ